MGLQCWLNYLRILCIYSTIISTLCIYFFTFLMPTFLQYLTAHYDMCEYTYWKYCSNCFLTIMMNAKLFGIDSVYRVGLMALIINLSESDGHEDCFQVNTLNGFLLYFHILFRPFSFIKLITIWSLKYFNFIKLCVGLYLNLDKLINLFRPLINICL